MTTTLFRVWNTYLGADFGAYYAADSDEAIRVMLRDTGGPDFEPPPELVAFDETRARLELADLLDRVTVTYEDTEITDYGELLLALSQYFDHDLPDGYTFDWSDYSEDRARVTLERYEWFVRLVYDGLCSGEPLDLSMPEMTERNARALGWLDGAEDAETMLNEQGIDVLRACKPGSWGEGARNAAVHEVRGIDHDAEELRAAYYEGYDAGAEKRAEELLNEAGKALDLVGCECGEIDGVPCAWRGPREETVRIEWMPKRARSSHVTARNAGTWPSNGALRLRVQRLCAALIVENEPDWAIQLDK